MNVIPSSMDGSELGKCLRCPRIFKKFADEYDTDEQRKTALIGYWLLRDPIASWRRLICELDRNDRLDLADKIRHYAEEPTGM